MLQLLAIVAGTAFAVGWCWYGVVSVQAAMMTFAEEGVNDEDVAKSVFLRLLNEAREEMVIYDDGNAAPNSIYEDIEVVQTLRDRLDDVQELQITCLFNFQGDTLFRREFEGHRRVKISQSLDRHDLHFKIIDGGRMGYVSRHQLGVEHRPYKSWDLREVPDRFGVGRKQRELVFGRYYRELETNVAA